MTSTPPEDPPDLPAPEADEALPPRRPRRRILSPEEKAAKLAVDRERMLADCMAGRDTTMEQKVAIVLNHYPATRDSDVALQQQLWRLFDGWNGGLISPAELFTRPRLTTVSRARAKIQNQLGLFLASPHIRLRRGQLEEEHRDEAREAPNRADAITVFADESGKTDTYLVAGGVWFANSPEAFTLQKALLKWREQVSFTSELHFANVSDATEPFYREAIDLALATAPSISFRALRHARAGLRNIDSALDALFYHMIIRGVAHEHETGRAPLPRTLQFWKDREDLNRDKLRLASLEDRVSQAGKAHFDGQLTTTDFQSVESESFEVMQLADLYVSAIARRINTPGNPPKAKDRLASYLLQLVGEPDDPDAAAEADVATSQEL